eukprot:CAMPEP_0116927412 /NCGR_PEP_ID=MMETSP0467-20121206/25331_1 /TAXON_ID=283647 /ORGANISM="Mesodinium pulex, Strain SPMC105" /LENGTH=91 /DNA_ID=CAMNT_0004606907 /DNA_START=701 /DNA_END=976 /DNA_ORIENTATION=+
MNQPLEFEEDEQLSEEGIDFFKKCLDKNQDTRWDCEELLNHPWLNPLNLSSQRLVFLSKSDEKIKYMKQYKNRNKFYKGIKKFLTKFDNSS